VDQQALRSGWRWGQSRIPLESIEIEIELLVSAGDTAICSKLRFGKVPGTTLLVPCQARADQRLDARCLLEVDLDAHADDGSNGGDAGALAHALPSNINVFSWDGQRAAAVPLKIPAVGRSRRWQQRPAAQWNCTRWQSDWQPPASATVEGHPC
jgi:hypothetical protein